MVQSIQRTSLPRALNRKYLKKYYPSIWQDAWVRKQPIMVLSSLPQKMAGGMYWWPNLARVVKPDHPISYSGLSGFRRFSEQQHDMRYTEDLKIQDVLRHEKGLKGIKEPRWKKSKPEVEVAKNWTVRFWIPEYPIFPEQIQS
jgi:hypothetical protein